MALRHTRKRLPLQTVMNAEKLCHLTHWQNDAMEQALPKNTLQKTWPLMTPSERLAIWEEARRTWTHGAEDVIAPIERGRDEADRELPPRVQ
jgi:hypothetical protein